MSKNDARSSKGGALTLADFRGAAAAADERRGEDRIPCAKGIVILPCVADGEDWTFRPVQLLDCSAHGLGIETDEPMAPGDQFLVKLILERMTLIRYTVRHCRPSGEGTFTVGAQLSGVLGTPDDCKAISVLSAILTAGGED